ncbi:hypothetical protein [Dyella sp.]|uniref:hypothetical protein n=1 Tax=Dyella sp. TaxID=1869338 RepID=UPI002D777403|nr:hypothetical protein [Dyella sp.]HET7332591.1 hypothetical protein [Dyella sp.]
MSAGVSATVSPEEETLQAQTTTLPYRPRTLTLGEATSREIFLFHSMKNQRTVKVAEYLHLALALKLEFDPTIEQYVERPRKIFVSPKFAIDIAFWARSKTGQERFLIGVPKVGTPGHSRDGTALRDRERMETAAQRHEINLTYVTEQELLSESAALRTYFELLPHVQYTRRIANRVTISQGIKAYFSATPRVSFRSLITYFSQFSHDQVFAVAASLVHAGILRVDLTRRLSLDTILEEAHA